LPAGKRLHELQGGPLGIETVAFSPDRKMVAASGNGNMIRLWDLATGKPTRQLGANPEAIAFAPDGRTLASGGHDCTIRLWDVATGKEHVSPAGHRAPVRTVAVSGNGMVATCGRDRFILLWEAATGRELRRLKTVTPFLARLALSPDGKVVASNYCLWDSASGKELGRFKGQYYSIKAMAFSPDSRTLAMAARDTDSGKDRMIRLWDVATLRERQHFGTQSVHALNYAPDGKTLAAGNADGTLQLWDVSTGCETRRIEGHKREVNSVAFSPDGKALASSSFEGELFLWDPATGKQLRPLVRGAGPGEGRIPVLAVAFTPNGKMLASAESPVASREGVSITLWEVATGQVRLRLAGHQGYVEALVFARDGRSLVSGSTDTTALVWDVMGPPRSAPAGRWQTLWADLLAEDAARSYQAVCALAAVPAGTRFLGRRLTPAAKPDERRLARLIQDLDSDVFSERDAASKDLEQLGETAEAALRDALDARPSLETRLRLGRLLDKLSAQWLRTQRALEALELSGTTEAKKVLQTLAGGAPKARLTREARATLARWVPRRPVGLP
jgi:WD40 repeat protein